MSETQTNKNPKVNKKEVLDLILSTIPPDHQKEARRKILELLASFEKPKISKEADSSTENDNIDISESKLYETLKSKRNFNLMPEKMFRTLIQNMQPLKYHKGYTILKQGEVSNAVYILLQGHLSVRANGKLVYDFKRTGDLIGEMSFITKNECSATISVEQETIVLSISGKILQSIGDGDVFKWLCRVVTEKLTRTTALMQANKSK